MTNVTPARLPATGGLLPSSRAGARFRTEDGPTGRLLPSPRAGAQLHEPAFPRVGARSRRPGPRAGAPHPRRPLDEAIHRHPPEQARPV